MRRSVRKFDILALCLGAFLLTFGASRAAQACDPNNATWANRDDDGDGFCNGADLCPYDFDSTNNGATCKMQAIAVPWVPSSPTAPHSTYTGATIKLMGIARNGGTWFKWDFGDGTSTAWAAISTAYDLSVSHAYTGDVGRLFIATLSVGQGGTIASPTTIATSNFYVQVQDTALSAATTNMAPADADVLVNMATDRGLWYLHTTMSRSQFADGATGYNQTYGYLESVTSSCTALDAFQLHGSNMLIARGQDPYQEDTQRLLAYMFAQAQQVGVGAKSIPTGTVTAAYNLSPADGIGIRFGGDDTYTSGICGVALGTGLTPGVYAKTGPGDVYNQPFSNIMQRVVDWFAYYQHSGNDTNRGGWWYASNSNGADGSTNQWPLLAMTAARSIGVQEPAFVKNESPYFIASTEHTAADANNGGWGYTSNATGNYLNTAKTAAGMLEHYFVGDSTSQADVQRGMGFLYRHWADYGDGTDTCWGASMGHIYAMYGIMKSMRVPKVQISRIVEFNYSTGSQTSNSFDWYYTPIGQTQLGLATFLLQNQQADGHWNDQAQGCSVSANVATAWSTMILNKGVTNIPPSAAICSCSASWDKGAPVTFDGSCSSDSSPTQSIAKYEWDFNYNGSIFNTTIVSGYPTSQPGIVYQTGYSFYTQDHNGAPLAGVTAPVVALRVTDTTTAAQGGPLVTIAKCSVNIKPPPHCPNISVGGPYLAAVNTPFSVSAAASFDVDSDPVTYAWDFHNNGNFTDATGISSSYTFALPGTYVIGVAGTDHPESNATPYNPCTGGCSAPYIAPYGDCTQKVYTTVQVGAHNPTANAGGPYTSVPNNTIQLTGAASTDPDGLALTYAWDLTGQGLYTDSTLQKPNFTIGAGEAVGTSHTVCLKVNNGANTSKPACSSITVIAQQQAPICKIISPQVVAVCTAGSQKINIDGSQSYDVNGDALTYKWTTSNCPATFDTTTNSLTNLTFNTAFEGCSEICTATLTVNNGYFTSSCNANIDIVDSNPPAFTTTPANVTFECNASTTANVNAWLANAAAIDNCAVSGSTIAMSNNFHATTGCGGVGVGSTATVTWSAQDVCSTTAIGQKTATVTVVDTTPPTLSLPSSFSREATAATTPVTFTTSATDFVSGSTAVICAPASGASFPVGATTVNCSSTDGAGNKATGSFVVTITDTTAPTLTLPAPIVAEATKPAGAVITFVATATDLVNGATTVICAPLSGSTFAIGATTVSCSSTDAHANKATGTFTVTVRDTTAPTVTVPSNIVAEATKPSGAVVTFASTASDIVDGATAVTCTPASGSTFGIAATTVTCTSTDAHANTGSASFTVTVRDTTPPALTLPANIVAEATGPGGAAVTFTTTALDIVDGATTVTCAPASGSTFALAATTITCSSTDAHSNKSTGTFTITVQDTTAPALTLPSNIVAEATGATGAVVNYTATATDLVDGAKAVTCAPASGSTFAIGVATVTCSSTDAHANKATGTFTVTVRDTTAPSLTVPSNIVAEATRAAGATVTFAASAVDIVDGAKAVTCAPASGSTFAIATTTVTCSSTDAHGNIGTKNFTVTVQDTTAPAVTVPSNIVAEATKATGAVVTFASTATDIVDGATAVTCTPASGSTFAIAATTVTCTSTDAHNNTATASFSVTVRDTTPPALTLPQNIVAEATGASGATVSFTATALDIVDGATSVTCAPASGSTFAIATTTVTCSSTDAHGNKSTGTFTVAVQDTTAPALTLPKDIVAEATGAGGTTVTFTASALDLVDGATTLSCTLPSGSIFPIGLTTETCTSMDAHHNIATGTFHVTVQDTTPPTVTVPGNIVAEATSATGAKITFASTAQDIVDGATAVTCVPAAGSTFAIATTTVTCSSKDAHNNTGSKSFTVTVQDTTAPVVTVPSNIIAEATSAAGAKITFASTALDIVDGVTTVACTPASGSTFAIAGTTVTCTSTDAHSNTGAASFSVTVRDTTPPALTLPQNIATEATGASGATVTFAATALDIVDGITSVTCAPASGATFAIATTTVTCTSADAHGNKATGTFTVAVQDTTAPALTLPKDIVSEATGSAGTAISFTATALDIVDGATAVICAPASGSTFAIAATTVTCSSTDAHGNKSTGTFHVTVQDTTPPAVAVPNNIVAEATQPSGAVVTFVSSALDIVDGVTAVTCTPGSGSTFAIATTTVTCSSKDAHNNTGSKSFTVTVQDTTAPVVTVPSNLVAEATSAAGAKVTFASTALDIVDGVTTVACTPASGSTFAIAATTVTCTSTDAHSNTGTASFSVTVRDTTPPALTLPQNIVAEATGPNGAVASFTATALDIVDGVTSVTCAPASGATFAIGTTTVTCASTDAHSNKATGTFTVAIQDTTAPALTLPKDIVSEATSGSGAVVNFTATALDIVDGVTAVNCAPTSGSIFAVGGTLVTCTTSDSHHNSSTGAFNVTVQDTTPPAVTVPQNIIAEATGAAGATVNFISTALDIVDGATAVTCVAAPGSTFPIGTAIVTCSSTDSHNNTASASFSVTVQDTTPPAVTVPQNIVAEATGADGAIATFVSTALDIVDGPTSVTCTPVSGSTFVLGTTTVTCASTDSHGNMGSKAFTVTVQDTTAPSFAFSVRPDPRGYFTEEATGPDGMTLASYSLTASDIVSGPTPVLCDPALPAVFPLDLFSVVSCTSTDQAGNVGKIGFTIKVIDTTPPVLTCPTDLTVAANGPHGAENWGVDEPTSNALKGFFAQASTTDLADLAPSLTNDASWIFLSGQTTKVTFTSVDAHQNKSTCSANITVTPENVAAPTLTCPANISLAGNGAEIDWTTAFRRPVSVELLLTGGSPSAGALTLSELALHAVQLTASSQASGSYSVRIRATDEVSGIAVECNRFVSTSAPAVAAAAAGGSGTLAAAVTP